MPKYLLTLLAALCIGAASFAQTRYDLQPVDEQDVCFLYAEFGLPNNDKLKIVVFTSYIYRYRWDYGYDHPALNTNSVRTMLTNAFHEKANRIKRDEHNTSATISANQVHLKSSIKVEWAFKSTGSAKGTGPELYQTVTSATTFNLNVRNRILKDYHDKGYKIYQTTLDDFYDDEIRELKLEEIHKLSSLDYETYRPGAMRELARQYQETSSYSGGGGSITITDSNKSSSGNKSNNKSNSNNKSSESNYKPLGDFCASAMSNVNTMWSYAKQTATYSNMKPWRDLIESCNYYFTYCGKDNYTVNQAYQEANSKIGQNTQMYIEGAEALINDVFTPNTIYGFGYAGLKFKPDEYSPTEFQRISFQISSIKRRSLILGEIGYVQSPNYVVAVTDLGDYGNRIVRKMDTVRRKGGWFSFGVGPAIRLFKNRLVLNGVAQYSGFFYKKNYVDEDGLDMLISLSGGAILRLGQIGIGVDYHYPINVMKLEKDEVLDMGNLNTRTGRKHVVERYGNWKSLGVKLMFNFKVDKRNIPAHKRK